MALLPSSQLLILTQPSDVRLGCEESLEIVAISVDNTKVSRSISNGESDFIDPQTQVIVVDPPHREPLIPDYLQNNAHNTVSLRVRCTQRM